MSSCWASKMPEMNHSTVGIKCMKQMVLQKWSHGESPFYLLSPRCFHNALGGCRWGGIRGLWWRWWRWQWGRQWRVQRWGGRGWARGERGGAPVFRVARHQAETSHLPLPAAHHCPTVAHSARCSKPGEDKGSSATSILTVADPCFTSLRLCYRNPGGSSWSPSLALFCGLVSSPTSWCGGRIRSAIVIKSKTMLYLSLGMTILKFLFKLWTYNLDGIQNFEKHALLSIKTSHTDTDSRSWLTKRRSLASWLTNAQGRWGITKQMTREVKQPKSS